MPGYGSITVNLRDSFTALKSQPGFNTTYGGLYGVSAKPDGKVMVKQQDFSAQKLLIVPYYGTPDYVTNHQMDPVSVTMYVGGDQPDQQAESQTTCYAVSGCFNNVYQINTSNDSVVTVSTTTLDGPPATLTAQAPGNAQLTTLPACCDNNGQPVQAIPVPVAVYYMCFAQLKYRPITISGNNFNHSFWWIQSGWNSATNTPVRYVADAGPSLGCLPVCGYLFDWVMPGSTGHYQEDNQYATTAWPSAVSQAVCAPVYYLYTYAWNWVQTAYNYVVTGPNSNTFAHWAANAAPFSPPMPPNAVGW